LQPFLAEIAEERDHELSLIQRSVVTCFNELIQKRDEVLARHILAQDRGETTAIGLAEMEGQKLQDLIRRRDQRLAELARRRSPTVGTIVFTCDLLVCTSIIQLRAHFNEISISA
jgi:hypothetical protein